MAKYHNFPGSIHEIGTFVRDPSEQNRAHLLKTIRSHTLVIMKERYTPKKPSYSMKLAAEMLCGKPASGEEGHWEQHAMKYTANKVPPLHAGSFWDNDTCDRLQACARSISEFFDVELFQLVDGALWIGDKLTNPADLNRNGVALFCKERLDRLRVFCNKKWRTKDTIETLYMEIVFQYCAFRAKGELISWKRYGDRLGLPLVMYWNNSLRLSVARHEHGFGMFSGWPSPFPTNVQERIQNDHTNNMLIESWYVNNCKLDMDETLYGEMDDILRSVRVAKNRYDPALPAPPGSASTFEGQYSEDVDLTDDFEGAGFNDDAADDAASVADDVAAASGPSSLPITPAANARGTIGRQPHTTPPRAPSFSPSTPVANVEGTTGGQLPVVQAASVASVVDESSVPSSRMPPEDIRSSLDSIHESMFEDDATKQKFRDDVSLIALLGQAYAFVFESKFDEAHEKLVTLQSLLG